MTAIDLLADAAWKSVLIAGSAIALLRLARQRSAAERSLVAHLMLAALVLLPVATAGLPRWAPLPVPLPVALERPASSVVGGIAPRAAAPAPGAVAPRAGPPQPPVSAVSAQTAMLTIYLLPLLLLAGAMLVAVTRLFIMRGRASVLVEAPWLIALAQAQRRMGFKHGTALLVSEEVRSPISWGLMRPTIVLDPAAAASAEEAEAIIAHELAHVARLDWAKLLLARLTCALFWFNPLVWLLARESHQLREEAADDAVLLADVDDARYATLLVNAARHDNGAMLLAAHGVAPSRNSLRRRVTRILDRGLARGRSSAAWGALCGIGLIGLAMPLAAFSISAQRDDEAAQASTSARLGQAMATAQPNEPFTADDPSATASPDASIRMRASDVAAVRRADARVSPEDVIAARATGIDAAYVAEMTASLGGGDVHDLIGARAVGVDARYAGEMKAVFPHLDVSDLVGARAVGVDAAYAGEMKSVFPHLDVSDLIGARATGVSPAYAAAIRREMPKADLSDIVGMRAVGVTDDFIRSMRARGIDTSDPGDVMSRFAVAGSGEARAAARADAIGIAGRRRTSGANDRPSPADRD